MVAEHPHGDVRHRIGGIAVGVFFAAHLFDEADIGLEDVGLVAGVFGLEGHSEALEAHAGVDVFFGQLFQFAVGAAVELDEYQVPDLHDEGVADVDQFAGVAAAALGFGPQVDVDLAARAAGAGIAHFPEVVLLAEGEDAVFGEPFLPQFAGLVVGGQIFGLVTLEYAHVYAVGVEAVLFGQQFPGPGDGFGFEIVAEGPVAQHFEHGVVVAVAAHFLQVVVFSRHPQALLGIRDAAEFRDFIAKEEVLELVHPGVGEKQCGVVFAHDGRGSDYFMAFRFEEIEEALANFLGCHMNMVNCN